MLALTATSANRIWAKAFQALSQRDSLPTRPSRVGETFEMLHCVAEITDPRQRWVTVRKPAMNVAFAIVEVIGILNGRQDTEYLIYFNRSLPQYAGAEKKYHGAYGHRLRHAFGIDQLQRAFDVLVHDKASRQVVLQIWDSAIDFPSEDGKPRAEDIPCNIASMLKIRDGRLSWMQTMRSNDLFRGFPYNIVQFTMLQEVMAGWLGLKLGTYFHSVDSFHLYVEDLGRGIGVRREPGQVNNDSIAIPKRESDRYWRTMNDRVNDLVSSRNGDESLRKMCLLPNDGLQNLMKIVVAEASRRQRRIQLSREISSTCTNPQLRSLWQRWARERKQLTLVK